MRPLKNKRGRDASPCVSVQSELFLPCSVRFNKSWPMKLALISLLTGISILGNFCRVN